MEVSKPSMLQWAGSSLKTITKKLRKPTIAQGSDNPPSQPQRTSTTSPEKLPQLCLSPPAAPLQIQLPVIEAAIENKNHQA